MWQKWEQLIRRKYDILSSHEREVIGLLWAVLVKQDMKNVLKERLQTEALTEDIKQK